MEIWKDIPEYEGIYEISDKGIVKSLERYVDNGKGGYNLVRERILRPNRDTAGYLHVGLHNEGKKKTTAIHQLMAVVFLAHVPNGNNIVVDHIDNDQLNNILGNLQLITNRKNCSKDRTGHSSDYVGVYWHKNANKWGAQIKINGKKKHLGLFMEQLEASRAYQIALSRI